MISIGTDLVEIERIKKSMTNPRFLQKLLGEHELLQLKGKNFRAQSVAANFCAKEAFVKAIGTGFKGVSLRDIEILRDKNGKPYIYLNESVKKTEDIKGRSFCVSVTHTRAYASAVVIAFKA